MKNVFKAFGTAMEAYESLDRDRVTLNWTAGARGKPGLNADIQNAAEGTRMIADPHFEILGNNATSALCTYNAEGGIVLTTATSSGDQMILAPHLDTNQSAWTQWTWGSDQETHWEAVIETQANIADIILWAGLKLTNTSTTATDDDQVFFRFAPATNSGKWQAISSIGGTDDAQDSGVTVAASTVYHLVIDIDGGRRARFYINEALVETSGQLTDAKDFIPYIGVQTSADAAKAIGIRGQTISRNYA